MDLYQAILRDEDDPVPVLATFIKELGDKGVDLSEYVGSSEELLPSRLSLLNVDELITLLRKLALAKEGKKQEAIEAEGNVEDTPAPKKPQQKVHEQLIDIEMIRQNSLNRTTSGHAEL